MIEKIIFYAFIYTVIGISLSFLKKQSGKLILPNTEGQIILKMPKFYLIMGIVALIIWIGFVTYLVFGVDDDLQAILGGIFVMSLCMLFPGVVCLLYYLNHKVYYNKEKIWVTDYLGRAKSIQIIDVKHVSINPFSGMYKLNTNNGVLKVSPHLIGFKAFLRDLN